MLSASSGILVLGMHRGGTSAITGCLSILGATPGSESDLHPPNFNNTKGYFEDLYVSMFNDALLQESQRGWQDERILPSDWLSNDTVNDMANQLEITIRQKFGGHSLWVLKDPRLSRLLPLWLKVIDKLHCSPLCVIAVRHPDAVAASLEKRDGIVKERGYILWLRYMLMAEYHSRTQRRVVVNYDELINNYQKALQPVIAMLDGKIIINEEVHEKLSAFISPSLSHTVPTYHESQSEGYLLAQKAYEAFKNSELDNQEKIFDEFREQLEDLVNPHEAWISQIKHFESVSNELKIANYLNGQLNAEVEKLNNEINELKENTNPSKPYSKVKNFLHHLFE